MAYTITDACQGCQACVRNCPTNAISGERKTVHKIDSDRCIACGTCGRVCPYDAILDERGNQTLRLKRSSWLSPVIDERICVSCGLCITICPVRCLDFYQPGQRLPAEVLPTLKHPDDCLGCGFCKAVCPVTAITLIPRSEVGRL
jgi:ferredoxin